MSIQEVTTPSEIIVCPPPYRPVTQPYRQFQVEPIQRRDCLVNRNLQHLRLDRSVKPTVERILQPVHPEDQSRVQQFVERESHDARNWTLDYRLLLEDGTVKHIHVVAHAVENDSMLARGPRFVGAVMDVTATKQS
jgi:hypothetical protein